VLFRSHADNQRAMTRQRLPVVLSAAALVVVVLGALAVDTAGQVGWNTSITVGSDGLPFVSYRHVSGDVVKGLHCPNVFCVGHMRRR